MNGSGIRPIGWLLAGSSSYQFIALKTLAPGQSLATLDTAHLTMVFCPEPVKTAS